MCAHSCVLRSVAGALITQRRPRVRAIPPRFSMSDRPATRTPVREQGPRSRSRSPAPTSQGVRPSCPSSGAPRERPEATTSISNPDMRRARSMHVPPTRDGCPQTPVRKGPRLRDTCATAEAPTTKNAAPAYGWSCVLGSLARSQPPSPFSASHPRLEPGTPDSESERSTVRPPQK